MILVFAICFACTACNNRNEEENPTVTEEDNGPIKLGLYTEVYPTKGDSQIDFVTMEKFVLTAEIGNVWGPTILEYEYEIINEEIILGYRNLYRKYDFRKINDYSFEINDFFSISDDVEGFQLPNRIYEFK
jgi:hypothetical protein